MTTLAGLRLTAVATAPVSREYMRHGVTGRSAHPELGKLRCSSCSTTCGKVLFLGNSYHQVRHSACPGALSAITPSIIPLGTCTTSRWLLVPGAVAGMRSPRGRLQALPRCFFDTPQAWLAPSLPSSISRNYRIHTEHSGDIALTRNATRMIIMALHYTLDRYGSFLRPGTAAHRGTGRGCEG